jgi:hypothetical protein
MPDMRRHRGMHPEDAELFGEDARPRLCAATADLSWLYGRGYAPVSSLKLVGDRYALAQRQRAAIGRCACAEPTVLARRARMLGQGALHGATLAVDGFNVLTTLEVALSGGIVLVARDGVMRDIAGVHGSYRRVEETVPALGLIATCVAELGVAKCRFLLDRPVSNSGRLAALIEQHAQARSWPFEARVVPDPDAELVVCTDVVASADGEVLDRCGSWFNLARECVERHVPLARTLDLSA